MYSASVWVSTEIYSSTCGGGKVPNFHGLVVRTKAFPGTKGTPPLSSRGIIHGSTGSFVAAQRCPPLHWYVFDADSGRWGVPANSFYITPETGTPPRGGDCEEKPSSPIPEKGCLRVRNCAAFSPTKSSSPEEWSKIWSGSGISHPWFLRINISICLEWKISSSHWHWRVLNSW